MRDQVHRRVSEDISSQDPPDDAAGVGGDPLFRPLAETTMTLNIRATAILCGGVLLLPLTSAAAFADPCDSGLVMTNGGAMVSRNCRKARRWAAKEARREREHDTTLGLINLGVNVLTSVINSVTPVVCGSGHGYLSDQAGSTYAPTTTIPASTIPVSTSMPYMPQHGGDRPYETF